MPWVKLEETYAPQFNPTTGAQFFLSLVGDSGKAPFDPSMMVHFRKRFSEEDLKRINELIAERGKAILMEAVSSRMDDDLTRGNSAQTSEGETRWKGSLNQGNGSILLS